MPVAHGETLACVCCYAALASQFQTQADKIKYIGITQHNSCDETFN